jgi:uncharacterized C2H2 Zn-finger protein
MFNSNCNFYLAFQPNIKTHIINVHDKCGKWDDDRKYKCPDCDVISKYKQNIKTHLKTVHKKTSNEAIENIFVMQGTERRCGGKEDLGGRRSSAVNIDEQIQGGVYNLTKLCLDALVDLIEEMDEVNYSDGEKRYKCLICKMVSKYKRHVLTHVKNVHGKLKKYFCQICDFFHPSPKQIKTHFEEVHIVEHTVDDIKMSFNLLRTWVKKVTYLTEVLF